MHFHTQAEGVGTAAEGILALSPDGTLLGGNRAAIQALKIAAADWGHLQWSDISPQPLTQLLAQGQQSEALHALPLHSGRSVYARLVLSNKELLARTSRAPAPVFIPNPLPQAPQADALALMDTGDERWRAAAERARRVLDKGIALLVQGESGVGKELFARALHDSSARMFC